MDRRLLALLLTVACLTGCAPVATTRVIAPTAAAALRGRPITDVARPAARFDLNTRTRFSFGLISILAMQESGNRFVAENAITDPAVPISRALVAAYESTHGMAPSLPSIPIASDDASIVAEAARSRVPYVLDVRTRRWELSFTNWSDYYVIYWATARLIDSADGRVLAEAECRESTEDELRSYDAIMDHGGALLKTILADQAARCIEIFKPTLVGTESTVL